MRHTVYEVFVAFCWSRRLLHAVMTTLPAARSQTNRFHVLCLTAIGMRLVHRRCVRCTVKGFREERLGVKSADPRLM